MFLFVAIAITMAIFAPIVWYVSQFGWEDLKQRWDRTCCERAERWYSEGRISKKTRDRVLMEHER